MRAAFCRHILLIRFQYSAAYAIRIPSSTKHWQELREEKLTASTFAAAVGFWPHKRVKLWREKMGAAKPFSGNLSTSWSNIKEEEAIRSYKMLTGNIVLPPQFQVHNTADWLAASTDGLIESESPRWRGVLEIKVPFFDGEKSKASPWRQIPVHCVPQAQGLMEIMDKEWMHMFVWTLNGSSLFKVYRDREYWVVLEKALSDFWWNHVVPAREIYRNGDRKARTTHVLLRPLWPGEKDEMIDHIISESRRIVHGSELLVREEK